jgi:hypothetical protein
VAVAALVIAIAVHVLVPRDAATTANGAGPGAAAPPARGPFAADLRAGSVVIEFGRREQAAAVLALARGVGAAPTPALRAAGQAVIPRYSPGVRGFVALAWRRRQSAASAASRALKDFVEFWLGRGVQG